MDWCSRVWNPEPSGGKIRGIHFPIRNRCVLILFLSAAILIAHLKLSTSELCQILMNMTTDRLEPAHIKQLLLYAPNDDEVKQYEQFEQDPAKLSEPDQFIFQVNAEENRGS